MKDVNRLDLVAHNHIGGSRDEVVAERLGHEREGSRDAEVALNDLEIIVLGDQLHVEGARDKEGFGNLGRDLTDLGQRLGVDV